MAGSTFTGPSAPVPRQSTCAGMRSADTHQSNQMHGQQLLRRMISNVLMEF